MVYTCNVVVQGGFPGNLRLILVLRPSTLLQRALSDMFFKYIVEDLNMKVPVSKSVTVKDRIIKVVNVYASVVYCCICICRLSC